MKSSSYQLRQQAFIVSAELAAEAASIIAAFPLRLNQLHLQQEEPKSQSASNRPRTTCGR
jgi:hypothetical protein